MSLFLAYNFFLLNFISFIYPLPDKGKWDFALNQTNNLVAASRSLFKGSEIFIQISCESDQGSSHSKNINIQWILSESICWEEYLNMGSKLFNVQLQSHLMDFRNNTNSKSIGIPRKTYQCLNPIILDEFHFSETEQNSRKEPSLPDGKSDENTLKKPHVGIRHPVFTITKDGLYLLTLNIEQPSTSNCTFNVHIEMKGTYGYLSAAEWPLLPFYGAMCVVYAIFAIVWLVVSFMQWRDLLRIQFWIGAVIFIGMIEKGMFYEEFNSINSTGESSLLGTVFIAELVSAAKRTLARMLVIIVSLGYGIVKPRLGSHLSKVLGTGIAFFILAATEAYPRVMRPKSDPSNILLFASIPLALLDSFICWWIFNNLVQTTRTLRLRRNLVKLTLYNHFTNTLIFAVVASTIFMLYSIKAHRIASCLTDWKELWVDDAYWHLLFSVILAVIMILWRPTNNNQRYAFSPLLDAPDDEDDDDDEEVEHFVNYAYGVKMRGMMSSRSDSPKAKSTNLDEDLKWVEENIPPCLIDSTFPILDSDEEIMNTKFEMSKME